MPAAHGKMGGWRADFRLHWLASRYIIATQLQRATADQLEQFYSLLHRAADTGNDQQLETALNGILGIIQENPLKDFAEFRKNMADPNFVLEL